MCKDMSHVDMVSSHSLTIGLCIGVDYRDTGSTLSLTKLTNDYAAIIAVHGVCTVQYCMFKLRTIIFFRVPALHLW